MNIYVFTLNGSQKIAVAKAEKEARKMLHTSGWHMAFPIPCTEDKSRILLINIKD